MLNITPIYEWITHAEWLTQLEKNLQTAIEKQYTNYREFRSGYGEGSYDNDYFDVKDMAHLEIDLLKQLHQSLQSLCQGPTFEQIPIKELGPWLHQQLPAQTARLNHILPDETHCRHISNPSQYPPTWENQWGMKFILVYPGEYIKGRSVEEIKRNTNCFWEGMNEYKNYFDQRHRVSLSKAYYLQTTPVTQEQWQAITGQNPAHFKGPDLPVENISWFDCENLIKQLNQTLNAHQQFKYRLPTDAEWEYACRAGEKENFTDWQAYAWSEEDANFQTHPVATKQPNAWGFYDMLGNVWEWMHDCTYYSFWGTPDEESSLKKDPCDTSDNIYRICRGGSWQTTSPQRFIGERTQASNLKKRCESLELVGQKTQQHFAKQLNRAYLSNPRLLPPDIGCRLAIEL